MASGSGLGRCAVGGICAFPLVLPGVRLSVFFEDRDDKDGVAFQDVEFISGSF